MTETINEYRELQSIVSEILAGRAIAFLWGHCPEGSSPLARGLP